MNTHNTANLPAFNNILPPVSVEKIHRWHDKSSTTVPLERSEIYGTIFILNNELLSMRHRQQTCMEDGKTEQKRPVQL
jgi:hypothetical protein